MFLDCSDPVHAVDRPCYLLAAHQCGHVFRARASTLPNHTKERDAITKFDLTESMTARIRSGTSPAATVLGLLLWGRGRILKPVTVGRDLKALAAVVLDVLADPAQHLQIDGSGMLQAAGSGPTRLQLGSRFSIQMRQWGLPYRVENSVTEYEEDRLIAWRPWVRVAGRRIAGGVTWRYELTPVPGGTRVTETYDVTTAWGARFLAALGYPAKMQDAMTATLLNLERLLVLPTVAATPTT